MKQEKKTRKNTSGSDIKTKSSATKTTTKKARTIEPKNNPAIKSIVESKKTESKNAIVKKISKKQPAAYFETAKTPTKKQAETKIPKTAVKAKNPTTATVISHKPETKKISAKQIVKKTANPKAATDNNFKAKSEKKTVVPANNKNTLKTKKPSTFDTKITKPKTKGNVSVKPKTQKPAAVKKVSTARRKTSSISVKDRVSKKTVSKNPLDAKVKKSAAKSKKLSAKTTPVKKAAKPQTVKTTVLPVKTAKPKKQNVKPAVPFKQTKVKPKTVKPRASVETAKKTARKTQPIVEISERKPRKKTVRPISSAVFRGKKSLYDFKVFSLDEKFEPVEAVYIISRRVTDRRSRGHHKLVRIGQTDSVSESIKKYKKDKHIRQSRANVVCLLREADERNRLRIEADLREAHAISCSRT